MNVLAGIVIGVGLMLFAAFVLWLKIIGGRGWGP